MKRFFMIRSGTRSPFSVRHENYELDDYKHVVIDVGSIVVEDRSIIIPDSAELQT